ncbi:hypothetical protein A2Z33_07595 [Candidatus Gottesmanbacteria bacterium RBG_16_52_11]|uniref:hydroxymethylglutaryl-CoA reductase (NADPH) n=1 Tax=Candidatus Gottesmanbacteria bacterium RBG_16_52_11 TaxID=1798374 RepID=A0A1F5YP34_9BACT|nr:MAG: hypothetical protein A2Z33_07595 [Candidatus Gottesmanbacteria bacterium RBG_16_52_11]
MKKPGENREFRKLPTAAARRQAVEKLTRAGLANIGAFTLSESAAATRNCENMIGAVQIPIGIAGPLPVVGAGGQITRYYLPLATTEGALVASVNRGCKAISVSGGAVAAAYRAGVSRGPVFRTEGLEANNRLFDYVDSHLEHFRKITLSTSGHLTLRDLDTKSTGRYRFVRFMFDSRDAMGMNMATIATDLIVRDIEAATGARCLSLSGNFCTDKKPAWQNFLNNRGYKVWAESLLNPDALRILRTTPEGIFETWLSKCMVGSAMAGSMGFNAQFANVLAALFLSTGQDLAHIAECAVGMTTMEVSGENLYVSVYLPDLMVGTVGGGTGLATQQEALSILGLVGGRDGENGLKLAEVMGAAVLAGEISLLASLSEGSLARAHQTLARGGKQIRQ